ncbi:MAG TPA: methyltransferase domain-containing protein [Candidatus Eremiobacteraceae bacterium]|nr:methyltransferase domain-containing protein [Candidatus Eremiobacteraceae bacterium]
MQDTLRGGYGGSIPANYDRFLRPFLFEKFADNLVARLDSRPQMRVLELACGTGVVTERLARAVGADATLVATDLSQAMIDCARARLGDIGVAWQAADALQLPFADGSFDVALCQFGWMFFPDKNKAATEVRRVLARGGWLLFNVWESLARNEPVEIIQSTLDRMLGDEAPTFLHVPYGYNDEPAIARMLEAAGFSDIRIESVELSCTSPSAEAVARGFLEGTPAANEFASHDPSVFARVVAETTSALNQRFGDGTVQAKLHALVCTAVAA